MGYGISGVSDQATAADGSSTTPSLRAFANLGLSDTQTAQIRSILGGAQQNGTSSSDVRSQIDAVLTPAQQSTLTSNGASSQAHYGGHRHGGGRGASGSDPLSSLNLTSAQQTQVQQIFQKAKQSGASLADVQSQISAILTPTQVRQLQAGVATSATSGAGTTA